MFVNTLYNSSAELSTICLLIQKEGATNKFIWMNDGDRWWFLSGDIWWYIVCFLSRRGDGWL
jgi:hypothetical protein